MRLETALGEQSIRDSLGLLDPLPNLRSSSKFELAELLQVDLIGTISVTKRTQLSVSVSKDRVLRNTFSTVSLHGSVHHLESGVDNSDLTHGDLTKRTLGVGLVNHVGSAKNEQARLVDLDTCPCDVLNDGSVFGESLAEGLLALVGGTRQHEIESTLGSADGTHAVVNTTGTKTTLDDLETPAPSEHQVAQGNTDVLVDDLAVAFRRIVIAKHLHGTDDFDTGCVGGDEDDTLLLVRIAVVGIRLAHNNVNGATRITGARDPPLVTVDDNLVALLSDGSSDVGSIGRGDESLRHGESRSDLTVEQRCQPCLFLLRSSVLGEHLHVACVRSTAVECLGGKVGASSCHLGDDGIFEVAEWRTNIGVMLGGQEEVPETLGFSLLLELFNSFGDNLPSLLGVFRDLSVVKLLGGNALVVDKSNHLDKGLLSEGGELVLNESPSSGANELLDELVAIDAGWDDGRHCVGCL